MQERSIKKFLPSLEPLERKQPLSGVSTAHIVNLKSGSSASPSQSAGTSGPAGAQGDTNQSPAVPAQTSTPILAGNAPQPASSQGSVSAQATEKKPNFGFLVYRITNPTPYNNKLTPPFTQVMVQSRQPVPGQEYNILFVSVRNGTAQDFDASSGFRVKLPNGPSFPILTGNQVWKHGQVFVFYILSKKYYPLPSQVHSGFEFSLGGARSVAIPGPSGIFQRVKYNPATFSKTLNSIVAYGPGNQGGIGAKFGLPNTSINEFVSAKTNRNDFGGYF